MKHIKAIEFYAEYEISLLAERCSNIAVTATTVTCLYPYSYLPLLNRLIVEPYSYPYGRSHTVLPIPKQNFN